MEVVQIRLLEVVDSLVVGDLEGGSLVVTEEVVDFRGRWTSRLKMGLTSWCLASSIGDVLQYF